MRVQNYRNSPRNSCAAPNAPAFAGGFADWNRRDTPYWFTVVAVDSTGQESAPAVPVKIERGNGTVKPGPDKRQTVDFNVPKPAVTDGKGPDAPKNLKGSWNPDTDAAELTWDPTPGVAGYRVKSSETDPATHRGYFLDLAGKAASEEEEIKAGDMVLVSKKFYTTSRKNHVPKRVFGTVMESKETYPSPAFLNLFPDEDPTVTWVLEKHPKGTPVEAAGETCLRIDMKGDTKREIVRGHRAVLVSRAEPQQDLCRRSLAPPEGHGHPCALVLHQRKVPGPSAEPIQNYRRVEKVFRRVYRTRAGPEQRGWPSALGDGGPTRDMQQGRQAAPYFDGSHFGARITCLSLVSAGLLDESSRSTGIIAAFNSIRAPKELVLLAKSDHQGSRGSQNLYWQREKDWKKFLRAQKPPPIPESGITTDPF